MNVKLEFVYGNFQKKVHIIKYPYLDNKYHETILVCKILITDFFVLTNISISFYTININIKICFNQLIALQ